MPKRKSRRPMIDRIVDVIKEHETISILEEDNEFPNIHVYIAWLMYPDLPAHARHIKAQEISRKVQMVIMKSIRRMKANGTPVYRHVSHGKIVAISTTPKIRIGGYDREIEELDFNRIRTQTKMLIDAKCDDIERTHPDRYTPELKRMRGQVTKVLAESANGNGRKEAVA